jgi:GR25 family glycosyltransferase involved in LPS biosynthesis
MNKIPRTFCITLKETPKRKLQAEKYFKEIGLEVEFFDGIHGATIGLNSIQPNEIEFPGSDVYITQGAIGCYLSHLCLWKHLLCLPDEEFLVLEDDVCFVDGFMEKFDKYYQQLPSDCQFVYVGRLPYGRDENFRGISKNISIQKSAGTHAYLIKKSSLPIFIDNIKNASCGIDLLLIERVLPKVSYYVFTPTLAEQHSFELGLNDPIWASLVYNWDYDFYKKKQGVISETKFGDGWYNIERNSDELWKWSQPKFDIFISSAVSNLILGFSSPIKNELIINNEIDKIKFEVKIGNNIITIPNTNSIIKGEVLAPFIPSKEDPDNTDERHLGICLRKIELVMGTKNIPIKIEDIKCEC